MTDRQSARDIEAEAARWVVRLDREESSSALDAELRDWLGADQRRQGALLFAQASWRVLDGAADEPAISVPSAPVASPASSRLRLPRRSVLGAMTGLAAAAAVGFVLLPGGGDTYETAVGEIRRVPLKDNSIAAINTASRVTVRFTQARRRVTLGQGEAWFRVAHNPARPFLVEAGLTRVQAVGTAFSVRRRAGGADVLVTDGTVRAWTDGHEDQAVLLHAGTEAFIADNAKVAERANVSSEVDRRLAWREGLIDLSGQTLAHAVAEFNRYNTQHILVADQTIGTERLFGVFRTDDPEGFARAAAVSLRAGAHRDSAGDIVLTRRRRTE